MLISAPVKTYFADIYLGLSPGYNAGYDHSIEYVENLISTYIEKSESKFAVNVQLTRFIYPGGSEKGLKIGLIQYPRFKVKEKEILHNATNLAFFLVKQLDQFRCSIQTPKSTYLIENDEMPNTFVDRK